MPSMHSRPTAVVADERPLGRSLVRFLLLEHGYDVLEETSTPFDTVLAAAQHHPEVIVAHEACVDPNFRYGIDRIRGASPDSRIIVVVDDGSIVDPVLAAAADFVVEDGPGLPQLVLALDGTALGLRPTVMSPAAEGTSRSAVARRRGRWLERLQGATAASIIVFALVLSRGAEPPVAEDPRDEGSFRDRNLVVAYDSLLELADRAPSAGADDVVAMAVQLLEERAAAEAQGLDVSALDSRIADLIGPLLPTLPPRTADTLLAVLGDLIDEVDPGPPVVTTTTPTPTPTRAPDPEPEPDPAQPPVITTPAVPVDPPSAPETQTPSPTPSLDPPISNPDPPTPSVPTPTSSPTPSPTDPPSPSPTDPPTPTDPPSPTPTESPSPTPSPTEPPSPTPTHPPSPDPTATDPPSPIPTDPAPSEPPMTSTDPPDDEPNDPSRTHPMTSSDATAEPRVDDPSVDDDAASGMLLMLPPGFVLAVSALARRRSRAD